jgi:hypothetical protein
VPSRIYTTSSREPDPEVEPEMEAREDFDLCRGLREKRCGDIEREVLREDL